MHHHWIDVVAQVLFWASLNYTPAREPLEQLERALEPVSVDAVLASCDVASWRIW